MTDQTAEAVQYWYDAAVERREERDRLRAVVARIGQMADYWEQHLPEAIRTPAVVSGLRAALEPAASSAVPAPATGQAALRDRIRRAVCEAEGFGWDTDMLEADEYGDHADAVLAVLPAPVDRAAVLREAADLAEEVAESLRKHHEFERSTGALDVMTELRRMADETQQGPVQPDTPRCAHCTHPKGDHSDRKDHTPSRIVPRRPWCHACDAVCDYDGQPAVGAQPKEADDTAADVLLASRCDACRHTLNRHTNHGACTVVLCVCGTFQPPAAAQQPKEA
jgi:hypothetical protein